jgi:cytoplasmic iron level regulating protein YaaA (DUF328/UPF0246 family)
MLIVVSPAKTLDYASPLPTGEYTEPELLEHSAQLISRLRDLSELDLVELMHVSKKIAELNFERYRAWHLPFTPENARQAMFAFKGDVYNGLDAYSLDAGGIAFAQDHLRMLSGLYGVLRPLDLMQPYRLEMGTRLSTSRGGNLYEFWGNIITDKLNEQLPASGSDVLVNLASTEYFKAVRPKRLAGRIVTPMFKEYKNGQYKILGVYAKRARGLMTRFIIDNRITDPLDLQAFDREGYAFNPALSDGDNWVFTRRQ